MDKNSLHNLKRLEEQIFQYKPSINTAEKKRYVSERLQNQLLHSSAVVKIQRMDVECESLMISLKQRLMQLQNFLMPKTELNKKPKKQVALPNKNESELSFDSSDDEMLSSITSRNKSERSQHSKHKEKAEAQQTDTSEATDSFLSLALRRTPRDRKLSCKSYSSLSTSNSRITNNKVDKQVQTENISGKEMDAQNTIHIKIPSLHKGNVHCLVFNSLNIFRTNLNGRSGEINHTLISGGSNAPKSRKKSSKSSTTAAQLTQEKFSQDQELQLSQLIQDVLAEACNDETLQATSALENINNNLIGNYDFVENTSFDNFSQCSQDFSLSQNSNVILEPIYVNSESENLYKKARQNNKRSNTSKQSEPPKKRGRKPKLKNRKAQPPTKSNLAQYVELFSNDCEVLPGSATPATSSTISQHLVSSTTQNYEVVDQTQQHQEQQSSSQPITYYIDGDWANGGPCQLVTSNGEAVEGSQHNTSQNEPFQDFVNYIENSVSSANNNVSTVLENNHSLPVSIPRSIANFAFQGKNVPLQVTQPIHQPSPSIQNSILPVINIQIPALPNDITPAMPPPPAHTQKEVVDLSVKSKANRPIVTESLNTFAGYSLRVDEDCMPLDLSICGKFAKEKSIENNLVVIDTQDEDFIRRLIEQNDFEFQTEENKKEGNDNDIILYDQDNSNKSFKAALDMPLLEFDASELVKLVESTSNTISQEQNILTDNTVYKRSTNNEEDSNYVSMDDINTSVENSLHFSSQSTTEIFNKLLDIRPDNHFLNEVNSEFLRANDLDESVFDPCRLENSTMCDEIKNFTEEAAEKEVCDLNSDRDNEAAGNSSRHQTPPFTSLDVELVSLESSQFELNLTRPRSPEEGNKSPPDSIKGEKQCEAKFRSPKPGNNKSDHNTSATAKSFASGKENEANRAEDNKNDKKTSYYSLNTAKPKENNTGTSTKALVSAESNLETKDNPPSSAENYSAVDVRELSHEKFRHHVVFSVSKISLSEDDNLYHTDSDNSSRKSSDSSERQSIEEATQSVREGEDFEEEELQNLKTNIDQQSKSNSKDLEEKVTETKSGKNEITNLTPLEMDTKLEDALDFEEDLDDALSLATSCFASPNDERFEDIDLVDINVQNQPDTAKGAPPQPTQIESYMSQSTDLRYFKIPKLSNATDSSSAKITDKPETVETETCNASPTRTVAVAQPVLPFNIEKTIRIVKNNSVSHSNTEVDKTTAVQVLANDTTTTIEESIMLRVFGITCLPFLVDKCFATAHCQLSHRLNDVEKVYQCLNALDKVHVNVAYKVLYNHSKLFEMYFNPFCIYYTNKNDRQKLLNMVNDCERYPEYAHLIIKIYESLLKCGLSRVNACRLILKRIRETSTATSIVEALIAIIMQSDWVMFSDFIEKYTQDMYHFNFRIGTLEQMAPAILSAKSSHLKQVFGKCVQTLHRDDTALLLNSPDLIQCVALLTTTT